MWNRTYDEGSALLLVGTRQPAHGGKDLDTSILVHVDGICVLLTVGQAGSELQYFCGEYTSVDSHASQSSVHSRAANLDCHDRVQRTYGSLEGFEVTGFIREHTEVAVVNPQTNTSRDGFLGGLKPGITLGLGEYVLVSLYKSDSNIGSSLPA